MYEKRDSSQRIADVVHRNTGMDTDTFLHPEERPYLAGLSEAAACFLAHRDEPVTAVGDYDVDGICATAILVLGLRKLGIRAAYRLPRRFSEGYGLSEAIIDEIEDAVRTKAQMKPLHREGTQDGTWSLLDYGSFVVHVFQPETREYYRLEALWNDAPVIDLAAEAGLTDIEYSDRIAKMLGKE